MFAVIMNCDMNILCDANIANLAYGGRASSRLSNGLYV